LESTWRTSQPRPQWSIRRTLRMERDLRCWKKNKAEETTKFGSTKAWWKTEPAQRVAHRYHPLVRSTRPVAGYIMPFPHPTQNCIPVPLPVPRFHSIAAKRTKHNKPNQKTRAGLVHSPMSTPEVKPTNGGGSGKDRNDTLDDTEPCYT